MADCKITVLRRMVFPDLAIEYVDSPVSPCPRLTDGQAFMVSSSLEKPEGFCDWAWNDIHKFVVVLSCGGNFSQDTFHGWMKDNVSMVACCTDGIRPVVFEIRRLETVVESQIRMMNR